MRSTARGAYRCRGVAAVELAILLPLIIAIFFGIVEYSFVLYDKAVITNAAREGARAGIVLRNPRFTKAEIEGVATNYCNGHMIAVVGSANCSAVATLPASIALGQPLSVTVSYTYTGTMLLAVYSVIAGPISMSSTAVMNYE